MGKKLFGTDGVRGVANVHPMTTEMAMQLGRAAAYVFKHADRRSRIVIGKDTRLSGYMIENALASGICSMGVDVLLVGPDTNQFQLERIVKPNNPRIIIPNHWDDMFRPLSDPVRPMRKPPKRLLSWPRRMNLDYWAQMVREVVPDAKIIIPERFAPIDLAALITLV